MSIRDEFNAIAQRYDKQRSLLIPCFDDFYSMPLEALDYKGAAPRVLDIGSGTGLFSSFVLDKYPDAHITMIDCSEDMMEIAKERFSACRNCQYITADYTAYELTEQFDIIISALSIHHLNHGDKQKLYAKCFSLLGDGGYFINADQVLSPSPYIERLNLDALRQYHSRSGLAAKDIEMAYERMRYDNPATLDIQLQWLTGAGFKQVDCLYKFRQFCVIYARK